MPENSSGDIWHLDEVFLRINGQQQYLWRAAERFFRRLLNGQGKESLCIITDILRSYSTAMRTILSGVHHINQPAKENGKCDDSNPPAKPNGFSRSTALSGPTVTVA